MNLQSNTLTDKPKLYEKFEQTWYPKIELEIVRESNLICVQKKMNCQIKYFYFFTKDNWNNQLLYFPVWIINSVKLFQ